MVEVKKSDSIELQVIDGKVVTTSLKVAEMFDKEHAHVMRDIRKIIDMGFNASNFGLVVYKDKKGENRPCFNIDRKGFTLLAMGFTGNEALEFKNNYIDAFDAMEKELINQNQFKIPQNYAEALLLAANQALILMEAQPKMEYFDKVLQSSTLITTTSIAKDLGMSAVQLNNMLKELGIQYKTGNQWVLSADYNDLNYAHTKTHAFDSASNPGETKTSRTLYWTEAGKHFINNKITNMRKQLAIN